MELGGNKTVSKTTSFLAKKNKKLADHSDRLYFFFLHFFPLASKEELKTHLRQSTGWGNCWTSNSPQTGKSKGKGNEKWLVAFSYFTFSRPTFLVTSGVPMRISSSYHPWEVVLRFRGQSHFEYFVFHHCYSFTTLLVGTSKDASRKYVQKIKG